MDEMLHHPKDPKLGDSCVSPKDTTVSTIL